MSSEEAQQQGPPPGAESPSPAPQQAVEELEFQASWLLVPVVIIVLFCAYTWFSDGAVSIKYKADINDFAGHKKSFEFFHPLRRRGQLKSVMSDTQSTDMMMAFLSEKHTEEMFKAEKWKCIECGKKATRLVFHPVSYMHLVQPMVIDMPGPVCKSSQCEKDHKKNYAEMLESAQDLDDLPVSTDRRDD